MTHINVKGSSKRIEDHHPRGKRLRCRRWSSASGETARLSSYQAIEQEEYDDLLSPELGLRLSARRGERIYVHAKPCILVPRITLTVAFREEAIPVYSDLRAGHREDGRMVDTTGEVIGSQVEGMERRVIGQMKAWYYPSGT